MSDTTTPPVPAPIAHASFSVERTMPFPPARVFAAFADPDVKAVWFRGPDGWEATERTVDFREGGSEVTAGGVPGGWSSRFDARYLVIDEDTRIVYSYVMFHNDVRLSASLASIELEPIDGGVATQVTFTEQGAFFVDGDNDNAEREQGTRFLLEQVEATLAAR